MSINLVSESTAREMANALALIAIAQAGNASQIESPRAVQQIVRQGLGSKAYPVGSRLEAAHSAYGAIAFDVLAHDVHKKPGDPDAHTMTLLMRDCVYNRLMDAPELLWANTTDAALPAGTYNFTLYKGGNGGRTEEDGTYQFTTTQPIPVGGGFTHPKVGAWYENAASYTPANITGNAITTYGADRATIETGIAVTAGSEGTSLGTASNAQSDIVNTVGSFNSVMRRAYGSNNWGESAARQWLNSAAAANAWWKAQTPFDLPPSYANADGLLAGFDADFLAAVGAVDITTARNNSYEIGGVTGGSYTTRDKFFLLSMTEVGFGKNGQIEEGSVLPYYIGATEADRIKYDISSPTPARHWWLRSPYLSNSNSVRNVTIAGGLSNSTASNGYGLAAACVIY